MWLFNVRKSHVLNNQENKIFLIQKNSKIHKNKTIIQDSNKNRWKFSIKKISEFFAIWALAKTTLEIISVSYQTDHRV